MTLRRPTFSGQGLAALLAWPDRAIFLIAAWRLARIGGHFLLIMAYDFTEASTVRPFAYFQLVFASAVGI